MLLARAIRLVVAIVVAIIVLAIILRLVDANPGNQIVSGIHDAGSSLVGPFDNVFSVKGPKLNLALNWGLAALIYAVVGGFIASFAARGAAAAYGRRRSYGAATPAERDAEYAGEPGYGRRPWYARRGNRREVGRTGPAV
jgi:hypothetical protein